MYKNKPHPRLKECLLKEKLEPTHRTIFTGTYWKTVEQVRF